MKKVLIVEDEPDMIKILKLRFEKSGYEVIVAANGQDALTLAHEERPDILIIDYAMPQMDGLTFLKECRASSALHKTPAVILTAHDDSEFDFRKAGADEFLAKPFQPDELLALVEKSLKKRRGLFG